MKNLQLTSLEQALVWCVLADDDLDMTNRDIEVSSLEVQERIASGVGIITYLDKVPSNRIWENHVSARWGDIAIILNNTTIADAIIYIDDGYLTGIEVFTFGEDSWPETIERFKIVKKSEFNQSAS